VGTNSNGDDDPAVAAMKNAYQSQHAMKKCIIWGVCNLNVSFHLCLFGGCENFL